MIRLFLAACVGYVAFRIGRELSAKRHTLLLSPPPADHHGVSEWIAKGAEAKDVGGTL